MTPRATYRLQLHKGFDFHAAAKVVPYLARLGISHVYASPILAAHPGSTHGYDIVDHDRLNPELGGEAGFAALAAALEENGLGLIMDFVPNHMGVGGADNEVWLDLLEWGQEADHAGWFDVDWSPDRTDLRGKVLVPVLGAQYGAALEAGHLRLRFDAEAGSFAVWAHDTHKLPVCPTDYGLILGQDHPALERLGDGFADLLHWRPEIMPRARALKAALAREAGERDDVREAVGAALARFEGEVGNLAGWAALDRLIGQQNWKASHFLVAADDINYRRFFNIATLAGLRMELPALFEHAHRLAFAMIEAGTLHGLRIDHIDGLFDPKAYLVALRQHAPRLRDGSEPYLVVEKILERDEPLRRDWPVDGTTGYEFANLLTGLFIDERNQDAFTQAYAAFTGAQRPFAEIVSSSKLQVIDDEMSSELHRLARAATRVARQHPETADFTLTVLQRALRQIVAAFPVYRTYIDGEDEPAPQDLARLDEALRGAARRDKAIDPSVFAFLRQLLSGELVTKPRSGYRRSDVFRCAMKFQQYCGPVMAKGVEDTAFYRAYRFVALNEVGGDPDHFGVSVGDFHDANAERCRAWPAAMLATSTHDTKRGEDTRARLAALSTMPAAWTEAVGQWSALLRPTPTPDGPDRNDEYMFYQLLVGTLPPDLLFQDSPAPAALDSYVDRLKAVMTKSMREAKVHSTWVAPDEAYESHALEFVDMALRGPDAAAFWYLLRPLARDVARLGARNSFAQTVLKFTVPGMPDLYQGAELWDLTMVDPDNRRPIDFEARQAMLEALPSRSTEPLREDDRDGGFKLALTHALLGLRRADPALFARGSYEPVAITGPEADAFVAFVRRLGDAAILVVASRRPASLARGHELDLPPWLEGRALADVPGGRAITASRALLLDDLLGERPAAVFSTRPAA